MRTAFVVFACISVAAGCSESRPPSMDAAITFDAAFPDGGPDTGPAVVNIGAACRGSDDCDGTDAYCDEDFPGGYCTQACAPDLECPTGSTCVEVGRSGSLCFSDCDLAATDGDFCARDGYGCLDSMSVCVPGCDTDAECATGLVCDTTGGFGGGGQCSDPSANLGDACGESEECPPGTFCLAERFSGIPGGACGSFGCDPETNTGCPDNGTCLPAGHRGGVCLLACDADADCTRSEQSCSASRNGGYCGASFVDANLGQICSAERGDCTGGICLSESETGFPDSYCVALGCDPVAGTGCPGDGVCIAGADGLGMCLDGCADRSDCRSGYECSNADRAEPTSALACVPGCVDASECGNDGFVCNLGTGRCGAVFTDADLGEPCGSMPDDCAGGLCLTESGSGWPSGTCAFPGCRLSGTGPEVTCPTGGACLDDGAGDPELGVCVDSCAEAAECRPGYNCIDSLCQPACSASDCGMGRTCSATTGRCE